MGYRFVTLADAVAVVPDGASIAVTKFNPMAAIRELIRQRRTGLHVIGVPTASFAVDLLIAAGCARSVETGAFVLDRHGAALNAARRIDGGDVVSVGSSCPLIEMQLRAGAAGLSFTPIPGFFGSDVLAQRPELKVIEDPYDPGHDIVIAPSLRPDVALIHALRADPEGNLVTTIHNEDRLIVQAARLSIATVEDVRDDALQRLAADEQVIPALYFEAIAVAPRGARPLGCPGYYPEDAESVKAYLQASREQDSMNRYIDLIRVTRSEPS